jgi:hypothetical protein
VTIIFKVYNWLTISQVYYCVYLQNRMMMSKIYLILVISITLISVISADIITNYTQSHRGCGPVAIDVTPILNYINESDITPCCDQHDVCYSSCGPTETMCNNNFLNCTQNVCASQATNVAKCRAISCSFYYLVKLFGGPSYVISQAFAHCSSTSGGVASPTPSMTC